MPRESTRRPPHLQLLDGGSMFEILERGSVLRVTLSGTLDRERLAELRRRIAPLLVQRGRRIVLDGTHLRHVDYRTASALRLWSDEVRAFDHVLLLAGWSRYLRTLLALGDVPAPRPRPRVLPGARVT